MARVPGTETPVNRAGLTPGRAVRCRRSQANADRGVADRRGWVCEVRPGRIKVLFDTDGSSLWLESLDVLPEALSQSSDLEILRRVFACLRGLRLEFEEDQITVFSEGFPADEMDTVRELMASRLTALDIEAFGVHEVAVRLRFGY